MAGAPTDARPARAPALPGAQMSDGQVQSFHRGSLGISVGGAGGEQEGGFGHTACGHCSYYSNENHAPSGKGPEEEPEAAMGAAVDRPPWVTWSPWQSER